MLWRPSKDSYGKLVPDFWDTWDRHYRVWKKYKSWGMATLSATTHEPEIYLGEEDTRDRAMQKCSVHAAIVANIVAQTKVA